MAQGILSGSLAIAIAASGLAGPGVIALEWSALEAVQLAQGTQSNESDQLLREGSQLFRQGTVEARQQAREKFTAALRWFRSNGVPEKAALCLLVLGKIADDFGEKDRALGHYEAALAIYEEIGDRGGESATLTGIGAVYDSLGEKSKALEYYERALPLQQAVGDRGGEATTLTNIGLVYDDLGESSKALEYYERALPLLQAVGDRGVEATTLNNIGLAYSSLGEKSKALEYYERALSLQRAVGDRGDEATTLNNIAFVYRDRGELTQAIETIDQAIALVEDLRSAIDNPDLKTSFFATVQYHYELKIDLLMQLHRQNPDAGRDREALTVAEGSRARSLNELLWEANADIRKGADPNLLDQERQLESQWQALETQRAQLFSKPDPAQAAIDNLDRERDALLDQFDRLEARIRSASPAYAALKYPAPLTAEQIQNQVVDENTALAQYFIGTDNSVLWLITTDGIETYELPGRSELTDLATSFRETLAVSGATPSEIALTGNALTDIILTPIADKLGDKRLVVVADGPLQYIPFSALPAPGRDTYEPLIVNREVVHLPSSTTAHIIRTTLNNRPDPTQQLAILADPVFNDRDQRATKRPQTPTEDVLLAAATRDFDWDNIKRLPHTRSEFDAIAPLFPDSNRAIDFAANLDWLTGSNNTQARYIHLATHGFVNDKRPELSGLVLSLLDENGTPRNGYLRLRDIFNLQMPAELVVLSACETALGEDVRGEGLVGLTRGLMYAGAKRAVVSLWAVNDASTADLMAAFYQQMLEDGQTPAAALRRAQIAMWNSENHSSPYYWAAFTLQGEWR